MKNKKFFQTKKIILSTRLSKPKADLKENEEIEMEIKRKMSVVDEITGAIKIDPKLAKKIAESDEITYSIWDDTYKIS